MLFLQPYHMILRLKPVGMDPLVSRFFRGVRRLRPPKMKLFPNWSIATVLNFLKSYGESKFLSLSQLLIKTCFLVSLVCFKRPACIRNMKKVQGYWELNMSGLRCQTLGISKTELHHISTPIEIKPFPEDPQLCPVYHMVRLDKIGTSVVVAVGHPSGGRLATTIVDRYFHHYFLCFVLFCSSPSRPFLIERLFE